jgi:hypothetical protein
MLSSMMVTVRPSTVLLIGFSFRRTARSRSSWVGMMNVRPTYRFFISPSANSTPPSPSGRGSPAVVVAFAASA